MGFYFTEIMAKSYPPSLKLRRDESGGGGIRTPGPREGTSVFKTDAFDHSATPPIFLINAQFIITNCAYFVNM